MYYFKAITVTLVLLLNGTKGYAQRPSQRVQLKPQATLTAQTVIRLGDVADISGFRPSIRKELLQLDLADWSADKQSLTMSRNQVNLRLQLAFLDIGEVDLTGPETITITRGAPQDHEQQMLDELRSELARQWNVDVAAVRVRLLQPLTEHAGTKTAGVRFDKISAVLPNATRPGTIRVKFLSYSNARLVRSQQLMVDAQLYAEVVCSARNLEKGLALGKEDIQTQWQSVRSPQAYLTRDDVLGKTLRQDLRRGQPISDRHLTKTKSDKQTVSARDTVKVVSRTGSLFVVLNNGVALQSGDVGDRIRVRNPNSQKVLIAKVISPTEVRVE